MRQGLLGFIGALVLAAWLPAAALAAPPVNTTNDAGPGSLRAAILAASPGDTISVPAGTYHLTSGMLIAPAALTLTGAGASSTIIDGGGSQQILYTGNALTVSGLTFQNGHFSGTANAGGGAIHSTFGGLTVSASVFQNNSGTVPTANAGDNGGGAIYVQGGALSVSHTTFSGNHVSADSGDSNGGGAIFMAGGGAPMSLSNDTFSGDTFTETSGHATAGGGAVYSLNDPVTISSSTFTGESATVNAATNAANDGGGALWIGPSATVSTSTFIANSVSVTRAVGENGGGGIYIARGPLSLTGSTVARNTVSLELGGLVTNGGGGVFNDDNLGSGGSTGAITMSDSTISDNTVTATGLNSFFEASGGGLYDFGGGGTITNSTIAGNAVSFPTANAAGGGIYEKGTTGQLTVRNSIVAKNSVTGAPANTGGRNCDVETGTTLVSAGHNIEDGNTCALTAAGDQPNTDPKLGPLTANGGPTQTRALLLGSPAIDHGDNAGCPATDQRGIARPQPAGGVCDIGAYESAPPASSATFTTCSGTLSATVTAVAGSSPAALLVKLDGGATRTVPSSGSPGAASLIVPTGRHTIEYWGQSIGGDQELTHHTLSVVSDTAAPSLRITSDQHKRSYAQNAHASVTITASALSGLSANPSHRHLAISTRRAGNHTITRVATNRCHRSTTTRFTYKVLSLFDQTFSLPSNRRCFSASRLTIRIHPPRGVRLRSVNLGAGNTALGVGGSIPGTLTIARPHSGRFTLKISATTTKRKHLSGSRRFSVCARH